MGGEAGEWCQQPVLVEHCHGASCLCLCHPTYISTCSSHNFRSTCQLCAHFTEEEIEAQRASVLQLLVAELGLKFWLRTTL